MSGGGGGHGKRAHEEEHEEHENHERWLVSYADMMTLLMVLFIVLFAISQVNQKKFDELKQGFGSSGAIDGGQSILDQGTGVADTIEVKDPMSETVGTQLLQVNTEAVAELGKATEKAQVKAEVENLKKAQQDMAKSLQKAGLRNKVTFRFDERGLVVQIATDDVLFASGQATLSDQGKEILNAVAPDLRALPNRIDVEGHTNSIPIKTSVYPSNWELSGGRASSVLRYLVGSEGVPATRMMATGYADTMPLLPRSNPASVVKNRRVEIVVLARVDNSAGQAVAQLGNAK